MQTDIDPRDLIGHRAVDRNGDKIGTVDEVYLDDATGQPEWAAVRTGIFGRDAFVPLTTSEFSGEELRVPYDKSLVKESPDFGVGQHLSPAQELQLYRYYGLDTPADNQSGSAKDDTRADDRPADLDFGAVPGAAGPAGTAAAGAAVAGGAAAAAAAGGAVAGRGTEASAAEQAAPAAAVPEKAEKLEKLERVAEPPASLTPEHRAPSGEEAGGRAAGADSAAPAGRSGPTPMYAKPAAAEPLAGAGADAASTAPGGPVEITCHEERLDISTEWQVTYTARLRKYVTSETVERHVPVVRERVRVERVPVTEGERDALTQEEIAEAVEEVTLREERPVVRKYLVPIERVRLVVERYTDDHVVREELHREHVEIQDGSTAGTPSSPAGSDARAVSGAAPGRGVRAGRSRWGPSFAAGGPHGGRSAR
ncbi:PRC and DUF2382 domain-containing protein, partial [Kitasatospora sp. NPDC057015]|uniref:PRC and DUF2382 domain-containing protein n=1 Tax=Kitasatospora sp. NPDC057015 TaxID=3346001 RepID=UPI003645386D